MTGTEVLRYESLSERSGIRLIDDIEQARFEVYVDDGAVPRDADTETFRFPVDLAVAVRTSKLAMPRLTMTIVRDADGQVVAQSGNREGIELPSARYEVEVSTAPMKLYIAVDGALTVRYDEGETILEFGSETVTTLGIRSFHERPAGTVTTTSDPEAVMSAVSLLGSSLQTTSAERSFPTLRGHPPLLELGEEFSKPAHIERPDTGVEIVVPPELRAVFAVAPLAYYLGAEVVSGREACLRGPGWDHSLLDATARVAQSNPSPLERGVAKALKRSFFLDCLTRTEGYYPVTLHERSVVEDAVDVDFGELYDLPLAERLGEYFALPHHELDPYLPSWNLTTDIRPISDNVEMLPFVANDLSLVRCPQRETQYAAGPEPQAVTDFFRDHESDEPVRGGGAGTAEGDIVNPEPTETAEHAWVGDGFPLGASKATPNSYRRRLTRDVSERTSIEITVVCNDDEMRDEDVVADLYGARDLLDFDVKVHYDLTRDQLVQVLSTPTNLLHYIGHVDERGMQCADGFLDVTSLDTDVAIESFLLNACRSFEQGQALVDRGSYGGVVTLSEVANVTATRFGQTLARLLNCGFTLRSALSIAQDDVMTGY